MTYPSQPSYTNPYGQPQPPQQQRNNLWLIGVTVIAILAIIMAVVLVIVQRADSSSNGGSADPSESTEGGGDGDGGEEPAGSAQMDEADCELFDTSKFVEVVGSEIDPEQSSTSASSSGGTGSVSCYFYSAEYDSLSLYVNVSDDAEYNISYVEDNKTYYSDEGSYEVTDYTDSGDVGFYYSSVSDGYGTLALDVAVSNIEYTFTTSVSDGDDMEALKETLSELVTQADGLYAEHYL